MPSSHISTAVIVRNDQLCPALEATRVITLVDILDTGQMQQPHCCAEGIACQPCLPPFLIISPVYIILADLHRLGGDHPVRVRHLLPVHGAGRQLPQSQVHRPDLRRAVGAILDLDFVILGSLYASSNRQSIDQICNAQSVRCRVSHFLSITFIVIHAL